MNWCYKQIHLHDQFNDFDIFQFPHQWTISHSGAYSTCVQLWDMFFLNFEKIREQWIALNRKSEKDVKLMWITDTHCHWLVQKKAANINCRIVIEFVSNWKIEQIRDVLNNRRKKKQKPRRIHTYNLLD